MFAVEYEAHYALNNTIFNYLLTILTILNILALSLAEGAEEYECLGKCKHDLGQRIVVNQTLTPRPSEYSKRTKGKTAQIGRKGHSRRLGRTLGKKVSLKEARVRKKG